MRLSPSPRDEPNPDARPSGTNFLAPPDPAINRRANIDRPYGPADALPRAQSPIPNFYLLMSSLASRRRTKPSR